MIPRNTTAARIALLTLLAPGAAHALTFEVPLGDDAMAGTLNTAVTVGVGVRTEGRATDLIGKSNLDPGVCTGPDGAYQSCQGLFKNQIYPAQRLVAAPGAASLNNDDGNLNYGRGKPFSAPGKVTSDLTLHLGDYGLFTRFLYFYDAVNNSFTEYHPNRLTSANYLQAGRESPAGAAPPSGRPWGQPGPSGGRLSYGPGAEVTNRRSDGEVLRQVGTDFQLLDAAFFGTLPLPGERELTFKVGRQAVSWGESTTLVLHSVSQANPVNANNFYRIGRTIEEVFQPVNMIYAGFEPLPQWSLEAFYQLEWRTLEAPAPGSYFADLDLGTNNAVDHANSSTGGVAEDPEQVGRPLDSPLSGLSNTTATLTRLPDREPDAHGQFGVALKRYFEELGSGTEVGAYYLNYHSRLPIASFYATHASCARREGNAQGLDATDAATFAEVCDDIPFSHATANPQQPEAQYATDSAAALDSARFQLEYPEDIHLFGLSFNTTVGDYSIQGEVAYRPNQPLQVDLQDLAFAAFGPTLTRCHDESIGCVGSAELGNAGFGYAADGSIVDYGSSDFTIADGSNPYPDLINVGIGHVPGAARAFPSFVVPYRGGTVGDNAPCAPGMSDADYGPGIDCYIRGYERLATYNFNLGTTRVLGPNENPFAADQIIWVSEWGATWVPDLPPLDQLQFEAPGTHYHASAGADGSGADGSRQACSTNPACTYGPDGIRFNPHQQELASFPDPLSWGYRLIGIVSYESVLPGISLRPVVVWSHDVKGTSPGPAGNFVERRKQADLLVETRYKEALSFNVGYTWFFGAGPHNLLRDRDYAQFFVRYQF